MITNERIEEIKRQTAEFFRQQNDKPVGVWSPTLTKEEKKQREKDIAAGIIPF